MATRRWDLKKHGQGGSLVSQQVAELQDGPEWWVTGWDLRNTDGGGRPPTNRVLTITRGYENHLFLTG